MKSSLPLILLLVPVLAQAVEPAKAAAASEPTPDELVLFASLNRLRTDFLRGREPINKVVRNKQIPVELWYWPSMDKYVPKTGTGQPVVLSPVLMTAARNLLSSNTPPPANRQPFDAKPALTAAGYAAADKGGTALIGLNAPTLDIAFAMACTNVTGTYERPDKKLDIYSVREACQLTWREAGIAIANTGKSWSVVIVLGAGTAPRQFGGVVYLDANRNDRYDPGEGKAGVKIACGGQTMTTGAAGGWWLPGTTPDDAEITFAIDSYTAKRPAPKGSACLVIDWMLPNPADIKTVDRLLAEAEKGKGSDAEKLRAPLIALLVGTLRTTVDDPRQQRIDALLEPVKPAFETMRKRILTSLGDDADTVGKYLAEQKKVWAGSMAPWFKEAASLYPLRQQVVAVQAATAEQAKLMAAALPALAKAKTASIDPIFAAQYEAWEIILGEIPPPGTAPGKKK